MNTSTCHCLTDERRAYINLHMGIADDFGDGAFFAYMEECGIDVSELEVFSLQHKCEEV